MNNKQKGMSAIKLLLGIGFIGFLGIYGVQIGIAYLDKQVIEKAAKTILIEAKNNEKITIKDIKEDIMKKISVNNIDLNNDDIIVTKEGAGFNVQVDFNKEIGINKNMKFVLNFSISEETH